jgi:hypothetical protein
MKSGAVVYNSANKPIHAARIADSSNQFHCDAVQSRDPTGTMDVRRRYRADYRRRWSRVRSLAREVIATQDLLGLRPASVGSIVVAVHASAFGSDSKIKMLQAWLDQTMLREVVGGDGSWLRPMIATAYNRAVARGQRLTRSTAIPDAVESRIDALAALAHVETQGVVEAVSQRAVRAVAEGLINNATAAEIVRTITAAIAEIGVVRSRAVVETLVVKAHATGTLDQFAAAGVQRVGLLPETVPTRRVRDGLAEFADAPRVSRPSFTGPGARRGTSRSTVERIRRAQREVERLGLVNVQTAGDDDVCPICEDLEDGGPYSIDEARSLIPAHPNCRCSFVPADESSEDVDE